MVEYKDITLDCGITLTISSDGKVFKNGKELKVNCYSTGYCYVTVMSNKHYLIHRLVASAFIQPLTRGDRSLHVHHLNENKKDNRLENLIIMRFEDHQALHKTIYPKKKKCEICGKEYIPSKTKRKISKTCSHDCWIELCKKRAEKREKKIAQYTLSGELLKIWESARKVQTALNIHESNINKCCNGHIKSYKGFVWKYAN